MKVEDALIKVKKKKKIKSQDYAKNGKIPIIDQSTDFIAGYTDDEDCLQTAYPAIIFGDHTRILKFVNFPFAQGADGTQILVPNKGINVRYFFYVLRDLNLKNYGYERHFKYLKNSEITITHRENQNKISTILGNYDDLIENNKRRIYLLEQMAKLIYSEWFVKFKFPNHEKVKMVESGTHFGNIPDGWQIKKMEDVAMVVDCLHSKKPEVLGGGSNLYLQLENIGENGKINLLKKFYINDLDYKNWISRIEVQEGDCVITNVGRVGAIAQIPSNIKAAIGRNMTAIRPLKIPASLLIEYLLSKHMLKEKSDKVDSGTIMDALNVRNIYKLSIIIPDTRTMNSFDSAVSSIRRDINNLLEKNIRLALSRDILLPKLMSEQIDVSDLDIKIAEEPT